MGDLPSGTVTFLFTDIESSSARWEAEPARMAMALARHDEILNAAISDADGRVFKHLGDGMGAAFEAAPSALAAAVAAMTALEAEAWSTAEPLRVRMGLQTGLSTPVDGDYFGPPVNRAARVMSAANGGQIVCSAATVALCRDSAFRDAGHHVLAGVGDEQLFVVLGAGSSEDRPLRTTTTVLTNVVRSTSRFVGRDDELRRLAEAIEPRRLVTLLGPGGVGKTRLATETALDVTHRFPDGVWLCELAAVLDGDAVAANVAETVGARRQAGMDLTEAIAAYLQRRHCLVVLDNCEHVLDAVVGLARRLLGLEGVAVLATSREVLGVDDEQLWPVPPLDEAAAMELFVDRCRHRDPGFSVDGDTVEAIREISRRVDGIPLALELAAGRTTALSPRAIADRLDDRFRLLRGGRRGERHQTLRDTVQWSYDLLSPAEAALFDRLSVFVGGFTVETAEAVCSGEALVDEEVDVVDLLVALVDKSMVQRDSARRDRFLMLETLRQFGEERLHTTGEAAAFHESHFRIFRRLAMDLDRDTFGPDEGAAWARFDAEWDNLRVAVFHGRDVGELEAAADVVLACYYHGIMAMRYEVGDWATDLLADEVGLSTTTVARLRGVRSWAAWSTGDLVTAVQLFDAARADGTMEPTFFFSAILGVLQLDDLPRAAGAAAALLSAARADDARERHVAAVAQPYYFLAAGDIEAAVRWANEAMAIATEAGSPSAIAHALLVRGVAQLRHPELSISDSRRALELALSVGATLIADGALGQLAEATSYGDDLPEALRNARAAIVSATSAHYLGHLSRGLQSAAVVLARRGDTELAVRLLQCCRRHGFRISGRVARAVEDVWGGGDRDENDAAELDMLDAAQIALDAIDRQLSNLAAAERS